MREINEAFKPADSKEGLNFADIFQKNDNVGKDPKPPVDASNVSKANEIFGAGTIKKDFIEFGSTSTELIALGGPKVPYGLKLPVDATGGGPKDRETTTGYGLKLPVDATGGGKK